MGFGKTNVAAGGGDEEKLKAHLNDTDNPHEVTAEQVGAAKEDHTHTAAQVGARPNTWTPNMADVAFLGNQPISAVANDTTANWANLGSGYAWYSAGGLLNDQPAQKQGGEDLLALNSDNGRRQESCSYAGKY